MCSHLIALTGLAHSGKDTSADYLLSQFQQRGFSAVKVSLADQLKVICQHLIRHFYGFTIPLTDFHDLEKKEQVHPELPLFAGQPFKLRTILQTIGTDVFRNLLFPSVWCQYITQCYPSTQIVIISDIRMPDEIQYFQQLVVTGRVASFQCYRVVRTTRSLLAKANQQHATETSIDSLPVTAEIDNHGSLDDLYHQLDPIVQKFDPSLH